MAGYILVNIETQAILGQSLNERSARPFVSISEAYETLAKMPACRDARGAGREARAGVDPKDAGTSFNAWRLCEVIPVEKP